MSSFELATDQVVEREDSRVGAPRAISCGAAGAEQQPPDWAVSAS
ncbi:hypothetical protein PUR35_40440 [Streptomyces sp. JV184]|nr:hypothetical protein [Streptomyces sp. JV184]MEE1750542.1 hypothetical protein [Streptomyces sp. JV184]